MEKSEKGGGAEEVNMVVRRSDTIRLYIFDVITQSDRM